MSFRVRLSQSACISAAPIGRIFMKVDFGDFYENISKKFKFGWNQTKISTTLHENISTFYCFRRCIFIIETLLWNNRIFLYGYWQFWSTIHKERIVAFPLPHWLRERVTILRYTYVACLCSVYLWFYSVVSSMEWLYDLWFMDDELNKKWKGMISVAVQSAATRLLVSRVRIPPRAWRFVSCVCCVVCR
jgi:hypothetical protein